MCSYNILNFQESTTILNAHMKKVWKLITWTSYLEGRVFANGPGDQGSIPGHVIPKTLKMVLDTSLLSTQHYKVRIKGKVEQTRESCTALPYTLV